MSEQAPIYGDGRYTLDRASSASRQHYIDTGRYLTVQGEDPQDLAGEVADLAEQIARALNEVSPSRLYDFFQFVSRLAHEAEYPQMIEQVTAGAHGQPATFALLDPDTEQPTAVMKEEWASRWASEADFLPNHRQTRVLTFTDDPEADFHKVLYRSVETNLPVRLPDGWSEA